MIWPEVEDDCRSLTAKHLFYKAYACHMNGRLDDAVTLYRQSIVTLPTAEACTFLGWVYRFQGKLEEAIGECKNAILIDPTLGNPYNDIGAYLIEMERYEESICWLEKATASPRYASYHYPWFNLGRAHAALARWELAYHCFQKANEIEPDYAPAKAAAAHVEVLLKQTAADGVR